jgi:hypothetical protein
MDGLSEATLGLFILPVFIREKFIENLPFKKDILLLQILSESQIEISKFFPISKCQPFNVITP